MSLKTGVWNSKLEEFWFIYRESSCVYCPGRFFGVTFEVEKNCVGVTSSLGGLSVFLEVTFEVPKK